MNKFKNKLETYAVIIQTLENVCVRNCSHVDTPCRIHVILFSAFLFID